MAESVGAHFSYRMQDELGINATCVLYLYLDPATTVANLIAEYQSTSLLLHAISGGALKVGSIQLEADPDAGAVAAAVAGSRVEQTGVFDFTNAVTSRIWGEPVPALLNSKISGGRINDADTDIVAWTTNLLGSVTTGHYTNNSFQHLAAVRDTFISFRKHRKQLTRESFETS